MTKSIQEPAFLSDSLWPVCAQLAKESEHTRGAIAYVGRNAHDVLPLKAGDVIVVDASKASLKAGSTNPEGIAGWLQQGATVYSFEGLHAKVLRFTLTDEDVTLIGSGNASTHSRDHLVEAALRTIDTSAATAVDEFIDVLIAEAGEPLDTDWLAAARRIYRSSKLEGPRRKRRSVFPFEDRQLWVSAWFDDPRRTLSRRTESALRAAELDYGSNVDLRAWKLLKGDERRMKPGDGLVIVHMPAASGDRDAWDGRWSASIGRVLRVLTSKGEAPEAIVALDRDLPRKRFGKVRALIYLDDSNRGSDQPVPPGTALHAAILRLWTHEAAN